MACSTFQAGYQVAVNPSVSRILFDQQVFVNGRRDSGLKTAQFTVPAGALLGQTAPHL